VQYRALGRTDVKVSSPVLGLMNFGKIGRTAQDEATAIVDAGTVAGTRSHGARVTAKEGSPDSCVGSFRSGSTG